MPYFEKDNLKLYYEDVGKGEAIIANHGLSENTIYWSESGVTAKLAEKYRMISIDMRGHGRTVVEGEPYGYDADTMASDFDALADHLGIDKFHILTHATGGMVAARYAMTRSERLISLMLIDTGSATQPDYYLENPPPTPTEEQIEAIRNWVLNATVEEKIQATKQNPGEFLFKMAEHPDNEKMWDIWTEVQRVQDPQTLMDFRSVFYDDPDPRVEGLRQIKCPTLILIGEFDIVFLNGSEIMAKEIPDNRHVVMPGVGHMTNIENFEGFMKEVFDFLETVKETGKATI
jgi:pimeloyl-ACP methyl ester carboxylesterase